MSKRLASNRLSHLATNPETFPTEAQKAARAELEHQQEVTARVEANALRAPRKANFSVRPRYTAGSPAGVDMDTAIKFAVDEIRFHAMVLTGVWGEEKQRQAETDKLEHLAYARWEKGRKVFRLDLITGEEMVEPKSLMYKDEERLRVLRNMKQFVGLRQDTEQELKDLEFRAMIHRQTVK
jgi:hypothetical protein